MKINDLVKESYSTALGKGWHDSDREMGTILMLIVSELAEALEEHRKGYSPTTVYFEGLENKPEGIPIEIADAVIRIADMCGKYGIDLEDAIKTKQAYNANRSYRHGNKVC